MRKFIVGVIGAGAGADARAVANARELGRRIAAEGWVVISGGRDTGVMQAVNAGAKEVPGSLTIGILPTAETRPSPDVDVAIFTDMHQARNNINVLSSDVVVACGRGGAGTVSEIALALKADKPLILLGADPLSNQFFQDVGHEQVFVAPDAAQAIATIKQIAPRAK